MKKITFMKSKCIVYILVILFISFVIISNIKFYESVDLSFNSGYNYGSNPNPIPDFELNRNTGPYSNQNPNTDPNPAPDFELNPNTDPNPAPYSNLNPNPQNPKVYYKLNPNTAPYSNLNPNPQNPNDRKTPPPPKVEKYKLPDIKNLFNKDKNKN
jgi:hypothetical protein